MKGCERIGQERSMASNNDAEVLSTKRQANWLQVLFHLQLHSASFILLFIVWHLGFVWKTLFFCTILMFLAMVGQMAGAHRLWAHGSYKATTGLKIFLMLCQTLVGFGSIYEWVRWHRLHHKYFKTDLDPYNPNKGFLYTHLITLTLDPSPAQTKALDEIDMSDLENDKVVMFQKRWYKFLYVLLVFLLPTNAPAEYWGEHLVSSIIIVGWIKTSILVQLVMLINSALTIWNLREGEKFPDDTNSIFFLEKSYWLSYHYLAPWDYQTSEYGKYGTDIISKCIRVFAALEWASDLQTVDCRVARKALIKSLAEEKDITECLLELSETEDVSSAEHYLNPKKYY